MTLRRSTSCSSLASTARSATSLARKLRRLPTRTSIRFSEAGRNTAPSAVEPGTPSPPRCSARARTTQPRTPRISGPTRCPRQPRRRWNEPRTRTRITASTNASEWRVLANARGCTIRTRKAPTDSWASAAAAATTTITRRSTTKIPIARREARSARPPTPRRRNSPRRRRRRGTRRGAITNSRRWKIPSTASEWASTAGARALSRRRNSRALSRRSRLWRSSSRT